MVGKVIPRTARANGMIATNMTCDSDVDDDYFQDNDPEDWDDDANACQHARQSNTVANSRRRRPRGDDPDLDDDDGGGDAPFPRGRSRDISPAVVNKVKETETIKIAAFPDAVQFRS